MTNPRLADRIRAAVAAAAEKLVESAGTVPADRATPSPGDLYVFDAGEEVGVEWLVVRVHPDDPELILLAPVDDFPLAGVPDVVLPVESVGRQIAVRCGETEWFPKTLLAPRLRVGTIPGDAVAAARRRLADLARGRPLQSEVPSADLDPDYEDWMAEVARARIALLARSERAPSASHRAAPLVALGGPSPQPLACTPEVSLAAEGGGTLFSELGRAIASQDDVRRYEVPNVPGGRLFLIVEPTGVRGIWDGPQDGAPMLSASGGLAEAPSASWLPGPQGRLRRTNCVFPWMDGRVDLIIGTDPPRAAAVEL